MTTNVNMYVDQGVDYSVELNVFDGVDAEYTIDTQIFTCKAKKMYAASPTFVISTAVELIDGDPNNLRLSIPAETTADLAPGKYRYDVLMETGASKIKILEGLLIILPTVSL